MATMKWVDQGGYLTNQKLNKQFQKVAQPLTRFRQFTKFKEAFGKHMGQSVNWLKAGNTNNYGKEIAETDTMPETTQTLRWGTLTVKEYFNAQCRGSCRKLLKPFSLTNGTAKRMKQWTIRICSIQNLLTWQEC